MQSDWLVRTPIYFAAFIALCFGVYRLADALTACQIGNGCTGNGTQPAYGNLLIGGKNGRADDRPVSNGELSEADRGR
jgi:hypothetical protein